MVKMGMSPEKARELRKTKGLEETKLQKRRIKKGLSQGELAEISGVKKRAIQSYEQRERLIENASLETLCDLAIALDCGIEDILEDQTLIAKYKSCK